ncbi:MAG: two-component regulator propeller domain-containing protein, partial [bacterium]
MRKHSIIIIFFLLSVVVASLHADSITNYTNGNYLTDIAIEGSIIWCGTTGGMVAWNISNNTYEKYDVIDGLSSNQVNAAAVDNEGNKWFATENKLSKFDGTIWTTYTTDDGLLRNNVNDIAVDENGNLWFATGGGSGGITKFDGTTMTSFNQDDGLVSDRIVAVASDQNGTIWIGSDDMGVIKYNDSTWTTYNSANDGLASDISLSIVIDAQGYPL